MEHALSQYQVFLMNAGIEINVVYEKFVRIFAFMVSSFERDANIAYRFPLLTKVSDLKDLLYFLV